MQKRIGRSNKSFSIYKFVTMIKDSPNIGNGIYTAEGDPRILPFGKFLRKTKINEMPQIFNIFLGDMSFIGPRPLISETYNFYNNEVKSSISKLSPGASGIGSIVFRNEAKILKKSNVNISEFYEKKIAPYKGKLEVWYEKKISFYTDIIIIFLLALIPCWYAVRFWCAELLIIDKEYSIKDSLITSYSITSNISELEIQHYNRFAGKGNYSLYKSISLWLRVLTNFSIIPLRFSTYVGIISSFVGFLLGLYFIGAHFLGLESPEGWPSLIVAILFIGGIQLLGLGIIGEYVGRSFLYQSKEPQFIIEEITQKDN